MPDVTLPWPQPPRRRRDDSQPKAPVPHYEIQWVCNEGPPGPIEVLPITKPPWDAESGRRGFLGAGIASSVAAALLLSACSSGSKSPSTSTTEETPTTTEETPTTTEETPTTTEETPTTTEETPTTTEEATPPPPGGRTCVCDMVQGCSCDTVCTCNKVCSCVPVCQAHRLLDPDPAIRHMAETVIVAMGTDQLPYLQWAATAAPDPLHDRINELGAQLRSGRTLAVDDLDDPGCERYLSAGDPVVALMAAQVLTLRALRLGTGVNSLIAKSVADALTVGHALHLARASAWTA
jgi:hypothetical protein